MTTQSKSKTRLISGLAIGFFVALAAFLGGPVWGLLVFLFFPVASREMFAIMRAKGIHPSKTAVCIFVPLFYLFALFGWERHFQVIVTMAVIFTFGWLLLRKNMASISDIGGTILTVFYLGFLPAHFILLRNLGGTAGPFWNEPGLRYLFLILFIVSASDIFAYYGGKRFGKNLLIPKISPKKTVEGSLAGWVLAVVIGIVAAWLFKMPWISGAILGALIAVIAQVGDLSESLLKRDAGIKDSGSLFPGHGGILDRTDSYIFSGAVGYYYILWFVLHQGLAHDVIEFFQR